MTGLVRLFESEDGAGAAGGASILPVRRTVCGFSKSNSLTQLVPAAKAFETKF